MPEGRPTRGTSLLRSRGELRERLGVYNSPGSAASAPFAASRAAGSEAEAEVAAPMGIFRLTGDCARGLTKDAASWSELAGEATITGGQVGCPCTPGNECE